jgi:hypothetical protein
MRTDVGADAVITDDREPSHDNCACAGPEPPRRRRWASGWRNRFGGAFLDGPNQDEYANRWLFACGQGG